MDQEKMVLTSVLLSSSSALSTVERLKGRAAGL